MSCCTLALPESGGLLVAKVKVHTLDMGADTRFDEA